MGYLLAGMRAIAIAAVFFLFGMAGLFLHIVLFREKKKLYSGLLTLAHNLAKCACFILNIRIEAEGELMNADPGALIVSNHVGTPDILVLGSCFRAFYVSKMEFRSWPFLGALTRLGGTIFVDRAKRLEVKDAIEEIKERLDLGQSVVLFPEAGVTDGQDIGPFKSPHFQAAILAGRPVLPVLIRYRDGRVPSIASWYDTTFFRHILALLKNRRLDAAVSIFPPLPGMEDRTLLAAECRRILREAHQKGTAAAENN
ncbi:MAG: 1-acyl-sn-glycerol-3-phosphate acyltransferase [Nitrospinae bacterium]|nr:1-acyl-sn-glycerol-3-phosphate acyltransferase [Nitrospinota bacterium]